MALIVNEENKLKGYVALEDQSGVIKYYIKEKLTSLEVEQIYQDTIDVYLDGASAQGEPVKDYRSQTGLNKRTAIKYLYQRLFETCVKDYSMDKIEDYLDYRLHIAIIQETGRVGELYDGLNLYFKESNSISAIINRTLEKIPEMLDEKKLKKLAKDLNTELAKASEKYEETLNKSATPIEEIIINRIIAMKEQEVKGQKLYKDIKEIVEHMAKDDKIKETMALMGIKIDSPVQELEAKLEELRMEYNIQ